MAAELLRLQTVRQEVERMPFPRYSQPKEVGCFSINGQRLVVGFSLTIRCEVVPDHTSPPPYPSRVSLLRHCGG